MRISADKSDPGYENFHLDSGAGVQIWFNGINLTNEMQTIVTADEETGEIIFYPYSKEGKLILAIGEWPLARMTGQVEIRRIKADEAD